MNLFHFVERNHILLRIKMCLILLRHQVPIHWHVFSHRFHLSFCPASPQQVARDAAPGRKEHTQTNLWSAKLIAGSFSAWRWTDATARTFPCFWQVETLMIFFILKFTCLRSIDWRLCWHLFLPAILHRGPYFPVQGQGCACQRTQPHRASLQGLWILVQIQLHDILRSSIVMRKIKLISMAFMVLLGRHWLNLAFHSIIRLHAGSMKDSL